MSPRCSRCRSPVPSDLVDPRSRAGHPLRWVAGLVLCLGAVLLGYLALPDSEDAALAPAQPPSAQPPTVAAVDRDVSTDALLVDLVAALTTGSKSDARALGARGDQAAARELVEMRANVRRLGITDLSLASVDEPAGRHPSIGPRRPARSWEAHVQTRWRIDGYDDAASQMEVTMTFRETRVGAAFVSAREDFGSTVPLWILDELAVERSRDSLTMVAGDTVGAYGELAEQAVVDVRKVLPAWREGLVVEVPGSERDLDRVLASDDGSYGAIAAVTTPVDGSLEDGAPVHIFVNPPVFGSLGEQGAQIVMTHEAAHVATAAATATLPTWLVEGFADYVALAHVDLPVEVTASQIIEQVSTDGVPDQLPRPADFESQNPGLGASYEAAWLACKLIGDRYGEARLIRFYERADRDSSTTAAFRQVLGTTHAEFTAQWRDYLATLVD